MTIGNDVDIDQIDLSGITAIDRRLAARVKLLFYKLNKQGVTDGIMRIKLVCQNFKTLTVDEAKHQLNPEAFSARFEEYETRQLHMHILHLIRNILSLFPLMLTWISLALATSAYQQYGNTPSHSHDTTSFLLLWQHSFDGTHAFGFLPVPSFADVALLDFSLLFLLVLSFIIIHYLEQRIQQATEQSNKELMPVLDDLVSFVRRHGTGRLLSPDDLKDLSDAITNAVTNAVRETSKDRDKLVKDVEGYIGRSELRITNLVETAKTQNERVVETAKTQNEQLVSTSNTHMTKMVEGTIAQMQAVADDLKIKTDTVINQAKGEIVELVEHTEKVVRQLITDENVLHKGMFDGLSQSIAEQNALHETAFEGLSQSIAEENRLHKTMLDGLSQNIAEQNALHKTEFEGLSQSIAEENRLHRTLFNGFRQNTSEVMGEAKNYIEAQTKNIEQLMAVLEQQFTKVLEIPIKHLETVVQHFDDDLNEVSSSAGTLQKSTLGFSTKLVEFGEWQRAFNGHLTTFGDKITDFAQTSQDINKLISQFSSHTGSIATNVTRNLKVNEEIDAKVQSFGLIQKGLADDIGDMNRIVNAVSRELRQATQNLDKAAETWLDQTKGEVSAMAQSVQSAATQVNSVATNLSIIEQSLQQIAPVFQQIAVSLHNGNNTNNQYSPMNSQQSKQENPATEATSASQGSVPPAAISETPVPPAATPETPVPLSNSAKSTSPRTPTRERGAGD